MGNSTVSRPIPNFYGTKCSSPDVIHMIVCGYIRELGQLFSIVPDEIMTLVRMFYNYSSRLYWTTKDNYIYTSKFNSKPLQKMTFETPSSIDRYYEDCGICIGNIRWDEDVMYKCGGIKSITHPESNQLPINDCWSITFNRETQKILAIKKLPDLPQPTAGNCLLYDEEMGLFSIGGYTDRTSTWEYNGSIKRTHSYNGSVNFHQLLHNKWTSLPSMDSGIYFPSGILIKDWGYRTIMVIGGGMKSEAGYARGVQMNIFDFETNKWREIRPGFLSYCYAPKRPGICYNKIFNRVYIGGGYTGSIIHEYDAVKNKFYSLPETVMGAYKGGTLLWFDKICHNLLFIASCESDHMEYFDIREGEGWNILHAWGYDKNSNPNKRSLHGSFGILEREHQFDISKDARLFLT